jgi:hypothetical protein
VRYYRNTNPVGQNFTRRYTPYTTVYLVIVQPKNSYVHRIYIVLVNPTYQQGTRGTLLGEPFLIRKVGQNCIYTPYIW